MNRHAFFQRKSITKIPEFVPKKKTIEVTLFYGTRFSPVSQ